MSKGFSSLIATHYSTTQTKARYKTTVADREKRNCIQSISKAKAKVILMYLHKGFKFVPQTRKSVLGPI